MEHQGRGISTGCCSNKPIIESLCKLPHHIIKNQHQDGLAQLVLHDLAHKNAFGFKRATFLIDNPDFDHLVGAAGFCDKECHLHDEDIWNTPPKFFKDMENGHYHNDIRKICEPSLRRQNVDLSDARNVKRLATCSGIENPSFLTWEMKHGNHGILLFDTGEKPLEVSQCSLLEQAAALLSMCTFF